MGVLIRCATGDRHGLSSRHVVGRSPESHLTLDNRRASTFHAELLWNGSSWELHDLGSRNGTYVAGRRLEAGGRKAVSSEMEIAFGDVDDPFELVDDGPPRAVAVSDDGQRQESEAGHLILPEPERPICTIFDGGHGAWLVEWNDGSQQRIANGATLRVAERAWCVELPVMAEHTWQPDAGQVMLRHSTMRFSVSADQERVDICLIHGDQVIPLPSRSYHHLLLALAQARRDDEAAAGAVALDVGWIPLADLLDIVDMDESTCNVYICRARRDLGRAGVGDTMDLVKRQPTPRRLRLGVRKVEIVQA